MKRYLLLTLMLLAFIVVPAQSITVKSFKALPMDMTASSLEGKRVDRNGDAAALIKVVTTQTGFTFEAGALGVVDTQQRNGEIWVWVPSASRKITILHQQLGVLRDYRYPIEIEAERTYEMVLTTGTVEIIVKEEERQQYLVFELEPKNATLEVNDQLWSVDADGTALQFVDFGTYTYRVRAANYITDAGVVTVDDPDNPQTVKVTLKPDFAEVTLKVDADAEIWVNNEKKGTRTWTGPLGKGIYKIECKQESHETTMISKEITTEMTGHTITLPAPIPIYGSLNVESTPIGATIYIDGKEVGKTPRYFPEILVGKHEIKIIKDGYSDYEETLSVDKGGKEYVQAILNDIGRDVSFTCNAKNAKLIIDGKEKGNANGIYYLKDGSYNIEVIAKDYKYYSNHIIVSANNREFGIILTELETETSTYTTSANSKKHKDRSSWRPLMFLGIMNFSYSFNSLGTGASIVECVGSIGKENVVGWYAELKTHMLAESWNSTGFLLAVQIGGGAAIRLNNGVSKHKFLLLLGADCGYSIFDDYDAKGLSGILSTKVEYMHDGNGLGVSTEGFVGKFGALTCYGINIGLSWNFVRDNWKDMNHF